MSTNSVVFTSTRLVGTGKEGKLTPDKDGYYRMVIGGLNVFNSAGEYYTLAGAEALFKSSSIFMRRVQAGSLRGEVGHPQMQPGMKIDDFIRRNLRIDPNNICCHFRKIELDMEYGRNNPKFNNPNLVGIVAEICPSGEKGSFLAKQFENGSENVCFSIRALTKDYFKNGIRHRVLSEIITFDYVNEPGIMIANKWDSPAMEEMNSYNMTPASVMAALRGQDYGFATEDSNILTKSVMGIVDTDIKLSVNTSRKPGFKHW